VDILLNLDGIPRNDTWGKIWERMTKLKGKLYDKTVFEVLCDKHPEQKIPEADDFINCENIPPLIDVDITAAHVEQAAKKLSGGAGISGFDSYQLQRVLEWESVRTSKAKRLIALNKLPGVRPVEIG